MTDAPTTPADRATNGGADRPHKAAKRYIVGHCYPWASWTKIDNNDWNVWTEDSHTNC